MHKFLSFFNKMHSPEFSNIIIDETISISEDKLDVIVFFLLILLIIPYVLALHPQMRNDRIVIEFQDKVLTVTIDIRECLTYQIFYEDRWVYVFYNLRVKCFDVLDFLRFRKHAHLLNKPANSLDLR